MAVRQSAVAAACAIILLLASGAHAQLPEPNCNSNVYEGNEVWSAVPNFIGQGSGVYWWGTKAAPTAQPVSWIDMCAQRLEACQANARVAGSLTGYKPTCVCDMWSCLNRQPVLEAHATPACQLTKPQLLSFYCSAARFVNATCSAPAYVPLPSDGGCPSPPPEGFSFDDIPGDGIRIPSGYQGLNWHNWFMLDGDGYQVQNGYYAGVMSSPKVAFNGYGYPAHFSAPENGLLTLHSMYVTSAWDTDNEVTIRATNEQGAVVGTYSVTLSTVTPQFIDFDHLPVNAWAGSFAGVKTVTIITSATQIALDNLLVTVEAQPGRKIVPPSLPLEFFPAPPGASSPMRKPLDLAPLRNASLPLAKNGTRWPSKQDD